MAAPAPSRPVRVLCLHGTCSSGTIMRKQLSRMQPLLKGAAELVFIDGPIKSAEDNPMREAQEKFFKGFDFFDFARWVVDQEAEASNSAFWADLHREHPEQQDRIAYLQANRELHYERTVARQYENLEETLDYLQDQLHQHRPIDGVLGFSQGANMASLLAAQAEAGHGASLSFAIHICPGRPGWVQQRPRLFRRPLTLRSLHIAGRLDGNPPFALQHLYEAPQFLMHPDGHRPVPGTSVDDANLVVRAMLDFALGRPLDLPPLPDLLAKSLAASSASSAGASARSKGKQEETKELRVEVAVNRELGIVMEFLVPNGTTVSDLKGRIALEDPTGAVDPQSLALKVEGSSGPLGDGVVLTIAMLRLEVSGGL